MRSQRTNVGLLAMLRAATSEMDPPLKDNAEKHMKQLIHAMDIGDRKLAEKSANMLAKVFLRENRGLSTTKDK